jgi:hypothetical protein
MQNLHAAIASLASGFASSVVDAIRAASLDDLVEENHGAPRRGPGRPRAQVAGGGGQSDPQQTSTTQVTTNGSPLARRSPEEIAKSLDLIAKFLKTRPQGLRSEEIRKTFGLDAREVPRILKQGLAQKKLKSRGQKRATTYSAV